MDSLFKKVLESGVIIAFSSTLFILIGFMSKFAQNRVLGISTLNLDAISYIEQAGNFFIQTSQIIFNFQFNTEYININFSILCLYIFLWILLLLPPQIFKDIYTYSEKKVKYFYFIKKSYFIFLGLILSIVLLFSIISNIFTPIVAVKSILQIQERNINQVELFRKAEKHNFSYEKKPPRYNKDIITPYEKNHNIERQDSTNKINFLFNMTHQNNKFNGLNSKNTYLTIFLLITILTSMLIIILYRYKNYLQKIHKIIVSLLIAYIIIFISYTHGVLGLNYEYPIVDISYKVDKKITKLKNVILLENNNKRVIILNRLNYMRILEIPYNSVQIIEQKSKLFLLQNCSNTEGETKLCEELF